MTVTPATASPVRREATLSPDGAYRYTLTRDWGPPGAEPVTFVMLNPSTADALQDDPTIRRCIGFARAWGYSRLTVVNLFAVRATDPATLTSFINPVGPDNDAVIRRCTSGLFVVAAWGASVPRYWAARATRVTETLRDTSRLHHLGLTRAGHPRHPLYLPSSAVPVAWAQ